MGPMQFIFGNLAWLCGVAARNDGIANVDNIDDAALSAAGHGALERDPRHREGG